MSKIANVIFPYTPTNDDELELTVGDKIEVIGYEEEGWWRGKLKGREGVFPSNFVQVTETQVGPLAQQQQQQQQQQATGNSNKLNSLFGSLVNTKNTISSNSLNNITTSNNSNNNLNNLNNLNLNLNLNLNNNNNNSTSSNNLIMNNTHPTHESLPASGEYPHLQPGGEDSLLHSNSMSENRPKPLRGMGFGDIFVAGAKTKALPADPKIMTAAAVASERPSTINNLASSLQRPIPKKPPPPAPADSNGTNGSSSDQAPALPPKPGNSYSPFLQQRPLPQPGAAAAQSRIGAREQARVIYAYTPSNSDELAMQVGDIIDVIDKNIEDQGWWRGELNGKIGVFPDNFVQLIGANEPSAQDSWQNSSRLSGSASNQSNNTSNSGGGGGGVPVSSTEGRIKSVFSGTPKGFSKELESNLEKHSNPASFLSLKRNKLQQNMATSGLSPSDTAPSPHIESTASLIAPSPVASEPPGERQNGHTMSLLETSPGKLNHITAQRAKGPTRRPPKNILNKRNQLNELKPDNTGEPSKDTDQSTANLSGLSNQHASEALSSLPPAERKVTVQSNVKPSGPSSFTTPPAAGEQASPLSTTASTTTGKASAISNVTEANAANTPKTNLRTVNQSPQMAGQQQETRSKLTSSSSTSSTPPWMVELRKTNAEKKRDPPPPLGSQSATASVIEDSSAPDSVPATTTPLVTPPTTVTAAAVPTVAPTPTSLTTASLTPAVGSTQAAPTISTNSDISTAKLDSIVKQISKEVHNEINELKSEVRKLREEFEGVSELKEALDAMKVELRTCQSATENQRRYIKDLVSNLADERKRIAAMQVEIDRNLK